MIEWTVDNLERLLLGVIGILLLFTVVGGAYTWFLVYNLDEQPSPSIPVSPEVLQYENLKNIEKVNQRALTAPALIPIQQNYSESTGTPAQKPPPALNASPANNLQPQNKLTPKEEADIQSLTAPQ